MTKKQNTILFIVLGTVANIILTLVLITVAIILCSLIFKENAGTIIPFVFVVALIGGMFIYQKLANIVIKKFNLEEKMEPIFKSKHKRTRLD
ncbi:MAG: leader peptide processing enzyme [Spirochaetales bacterium]